MEIITYTLMIITLGAFIRFFYKISKEPDSYSHKTH